MVGGVCGAWLYQFFIGFHLVNAETVASSPLQSVTSDEASGKIHCTVQSTTVEHSPISDEKIVPGSVPGKNRPKRANGILDAVGESPTKDTSDYVEYLRPRFQLKNDLYRCVLCEFFCTALLLFGGTATNARHTLMNSNRWIDISFGWGFSLFYAVLVGFKISGSHLNPAVSLNVYTAGKISFMRFLLYSIAQILGGYFGSLLTFLMYIDYFLDDRSMANAGIFSTYPRAYLSVIGGVVDQVIGTAFLCFILGGITDPHNWIPSYLQPLLIGILVLLIGTAIGINSGYAINPARDLGPRLFTLSAGWGAETFTYRGGMWFWVPVVCPLIGGLLGAWMYTVFIGLQIHSKRHENS
ncbi:hypothetical protein AB6A40_004452 [Gnathostoma spinigerum]|uniref:Aquaporin n=1 Tax=Gnathostoma spinigerum TaxID=75299 RepID=A0ABD6ELA1_9BILA